MIDFSYPESPRSKDSDFASGQHFPDPYHWLENEDNQVVCWQNAQNKLTDQFLEQWPHLKSLEEINERFLVDRIFSVPRYCGQRWFRFGVNPVNGQPSVIASKLPYGDGEIIYSPATDATGQDPIMVWLSPSPNGNILAVGLCRDGSENNQIHLIDVPSGKALPDCPVHKLMDGWTGGVSWLPDSSGFYYLALLGNPADFNQKIFFYSISDRESRPVDLPLPDQNSKDYILIKVSRDGRYHIAHQGLANPMPVAVLDTFRAKAEWSSFITLSEASLVGYVVRDDRLFAVTDINAPNGRVVSIDLLSAEANDPSTWTEVVPESSSVIRSITEVGDSLYLSEFIDAYSQIRIVNFDGDFLGYVPLPYRGVVDEPIIPLQRLALKQAFRSYLFSYSTLTQSSAVYLYNQTDHRITTVLAPQVTLEEAIIEDYWTTSEEPRVYYQTVRLRTLDPTIAQPTLIYAYGGFSFETPPAYYGAMATFVASGGIAVIGHIRGDSDLGAVWALGGRKKSKANGYRDLFTIAQDLIKKDITTPDLLALTGRSNGGLMSAVALTQKPSLWKVVSPQVPIVDMIGAYRHAYGNWLNEIEYASSDDYEDIIAMLEYSPYHQIREGEKYPAVFIDAGQNDPRCPAWHARKLAAALQYANVSGNPVLLRVWENAGHGPANSRAMKIAQYTAWLAFVMQQLGMKP